MEVEVEGGRMFVKLSFSTQEVISSLLKVLIHRNISHERKSKYFAPLREILQNLGQDI